MPWPIKAFILYLLLVGFPADADQFPLVVPTSGSTVNARLTSIDDGRVVFLDDTNVEKTFSLDQLVRWGSITEAGNDHLVMLTDGTQLVGVITAVTRTALVIETDVWGELTLPRDVVAGAIWEQPTERVERWKFRDQFAQSIDVGRLILRNGDLMSGQLLNGGRQFLKFRANAGEVDLKNELVAAWQPSGVEENAPRDTRRSVLGMRDGTKLVATSIRLGDRLEVDLVCGIHLGSLGEIRPVDEGLVNYFRPANSSVTYLSDLPTIGHKHIPFLTTKWDWQADRSVLGGPISSNAKLYGKGIGMHSTSRLAYDLPQGFTEFQAHMSIDQSSGKRGSVVFRVFVSDDGQAWKEGYRSDVVVGGELPRPVKVNVASAKRLALVVDFADRGDQLDRANWIGARLVKLTK